MIFNFNPPLMNYIHAFFIIGGLWLVSKMFWMCVYQWRYGGDYGDRYIKGLITDEEKIKLKSQRRDN